LSPMLSNLDLAPVEAPPSYELIQPVRVAHVVEAAPVPQNADQDNEWVYADGEADPDDIEGNWDYEPDGESTEEENGEDDAEDEPEEAFEGGPIVLGSRARNGHVLNDAIDLDYQPPVAAPVMPAPVLPVAMAPAHAPAVFEFKAPGSDVVMHCSGSAAAIGRSFVNSFNETRRWLTFLSRSSPHLGPEFAVPNSSVPLNPSENSAQQYETKVNSSCAEVKRRCELALAQVAQIPIHFVRAGLARNMRRRVQTAVTTRESLRQQAAQLQNQHRQLRRAQQLDHLRGDLLLQ